MVFEITLEARPRYMPQPAHLSLCQAESAIPDLYDYHRTGWVVAGVIGRRVRQQTVIQVKSFDILQRIANTAAEIPACPAGLSSGLAEWPSPEVRTVCQVRRHDRWFHIELRLVGRDELLAHRSIRAIGWQIPMNDERLTDKRDAFDILAATIDKVDQSNPVPA